jgi:hypothetical protein
MCQTVFVLWIEESAVVSEGTTLSNAIFLGEGKLLLQMDS